MSRKKEKKDMDAAIKRPTTPAESLKQSMQQMKLIQEGKLPKKSWRDYIKEQKRDN